jgi:hypothetical protein
MDLDIEMGSGTLIYTQSFIKIVSVTEKLIGDDKIYRHTESKVILQAHFYF